MKVYKKEIRPMVQPPSLQGFSNKPYPFFTEDSWVAEDFKDYFQQYCENELEDPMSTIFFDERYVEVELPISEVIINKELMDNEMACALMAHASIEQMRKDVKQQ